MFNTEAMKWQCLTDCNFLTRTHNILTMKTKYVALALYIYYA